MSVFIEQIAYDGVIELTVPQGRTWKVQAISEAAPAAASRVRIVFTDPSGVRAIYYRDFITPAGTVRTLSAAIGGPLETTADTIGETLPNIRLASGCKVQVFIDDPETGDITFLVED